ncbi:hypothetical protein H312_02455 [Anncaliia algerae PRA339]|uniref:Uncharacterized protein n=1 Tax=Anncaliia algerae PRA339 TaxID=1288291 RepID=A0A059EYP6_9MICR|nr:hypothetical protein H312_02455 [Anncaliia algerae PRA339]
MNHKKFIKNLVLSLIGDFREGSNLRYGPSLTSDAEDRLDGKLHILKVSSNEKTMIAWYAQTENYLEEERQQFTFVQSATDDHIFMLENVSKNTTR